MIANETWWITGASSGIGAALARALDRAGARLVLSGRNEAALAEVAAGLARDPLVLPFEATDTAALPALAERAFAFAATYGGGLGGLVNNAGISQRSLAVDTVFDVYRRIVDVDLLAPIALTQAVLPRMVAVGKGTIVAISSVAGIVGSPLRSAYSAAKHGLIGYCDSVRAEVEPHGLRVLVVAPGSVRTEVSRNALGPDGRPRGFSDDAIDQGMAPDDAAARIVAAIEGGVRELVLAEGMEAEAARLRRADPERLFDMMAALVASGYARQLGAAKD